jgi:hypothetical protein
MAIDALEAPAHAALPTTQTNRFSVRKREGIVMLMRRARLHRTKSGDANAAAAPREGQKMSAPRQPSIPTIGVSQRIIKMTAGAPRQARDAQN